MKVIVLTCERRGTASKCLPVLCKNKNIKVDRVILAQAVSPGWKKLFRSKVKKIFNIGILGTLNGIRIRDWYRDGEADDLVDVCNVHNVSFFETEFINCEETRKLFAESRADLGLSLGNGYIPKSVFSLPKNGMINLHGEILPNYQNAQSVVWPIYMMDKYTGLTIHQIDSHIDTGDILFQEKYPIEFHKTLEKTVRCSIEITRQKIPDAISYVCENYVTLAKDAKKQGKGVSYTTPSIWKFFRMVRNNKTMMKEFSNK